ncbi:MAG: AAA family ATPase [Egibacteraceae bacterium]
MASHEWDDGDRRLKAELMAFVPALACSPTLALRASLKLPDRWWESLRRSLDALAAWPTERIGFSQELVTQRLLSFFGGKVDPTVGAWTTAHADLHWANLTAPDCHLLDWEGWGAAPAGYDAALLYCTSLLQPGIAHRVHEVFADLLDSPDGVRAQLCAAATLLLRVAYGHHLDLAEPLHRHASRLLRASAVPGRSVSREGREASSRPRLRAMTANDGVGCGSVGGGFLRWVELADGPGFDPARYPFSLPVVRALRGYRLDLHPAVTFLTGDNGTGKSTLVEAIAVALGINPEGGSRSFRFATRPSESELGNYLRLTRSARRPSTEYFLRAESFYNVATEVEALERVDSGLLASSYGGRSLHQRSHGESFLALTMHRFGPKGLYLLDEPESALSVNGCLALLRRMYDLVRASSQFVVATHSPILMAFPGACIIEVNENGLHEVGYEETQSYQLTSSFLTNPQQFLRYLLTDDP